MRKSFLFEQIYKTDKIRCDAITCHCEKLFDHCEKWFCHCKKSFCHLKWFSNDWNKIFLFSYGYSVMVIQLLLLKLWTILWEMKANLCNLLLINSTMCLPANKCFSDKVVVMSMYSQMFHIFSIGEMWWTVVASTCPTQSTHLCQW